MRLRLTPVDPGFYGLFAGVADNLREGVRVLAEALADGADRAAYAARLREVEHAGDERTHEIVRRVGSTFVTPFAREDIYHLAAALDDVMDDIEAALDLMVLHQLTLLPLEVLEVVDALGRAAELTSRAMPRLRSLPDLGDYWVEVNRLENHADRVHRRLLARILSGEYDPLTAHQIKGVVDALESAMNGFERVANTVERIALKES